jgi:hypothetical protein
VASLGDLRLPVGVAAQAARAAFLSDEAQSYDGEWSCGVPCRGEGEYLGEEGSLFAGTWLRPRPQEEGQKCGDPEAGGGPAAAPPQAKRANAAAAPPPPLRLGSVSS